MKQAAIMLIIKDGLILGITRRHDKTKFGLPGGKVEPNETPSAAAIRETFEETGLIVKSCVQVYQRTELGDGPHGVDFYSTCFYASNWIGEPHDSEEGNIKWLTPDEITTTKAAFGDYNRKTLDVFKSMFPNVDLLGELCSGGCNNTGWQSGDNEGFICNLCDRSCTCDKALDAFASNCKIHLILM